MTRTGGGVRRVFLGREVGIVLGVLLVGSILVQASFLPTYLAVLFASGVRNVYVAWLGNGVLFWAVALLGLYAQAVVVTAAYLVVRTVARSLRSTSTGES
jgi:general stress protein CsbA